MYFAPELIAGGAFVEYGEPIALTISSTKKYITKGIIYMLSASFAGYAYAKNK